MRIVVVVDGKRKEWFEGNNLSVDIVHDSIALSAENPKKHLTVLKNEGTKEESILATFEKWEYWRYVE